MKNIALVGFSVFAMLISCKCKKVTTDVAAVEATASAEVKNPENTMNSSEKAQEAATVEYEANSRGYFLKVKYANGKLAFTNERDSDKMKEVALTKAQADELNSLLYSIKAESLPELKAPTEKRFYDGAAMANIHINKNGNVYSSDTFDHGFPPASIEQFVKKLLSYTKEK